MTDTPEKQLPDTALTVEKQLLAHEPPKDWRIPPEFVRCYEEVLSRFILPHEVLDLLVLPETMDLQMLKLMKAFKLFPDDYPKLFTLIRTSRGLADKAQGDDILLRMYGMENTRNFVLAIAASQQALGKKFEWEGGGRPKLPPKQILEYALKTLSAYEGRAVELAFSSGLIFDILSMTAQKAMESSIRMKSHIEDTVDQAIVTAKIGLEVCRRVKDLRLVDYVYSACILRGAGKIVAGILKEEALDLFAREKRDDLPFSAQVLCEENLLGISSDYYAGLICACFPLFKPIQDALHFQRRPHLLKHRGQNDLANLAMTTALASNMAEHPIELTEPDDPAFAAKCTAQWLRPEVRDLGLTLQDLYQVAEKMS